MVKNNAVKEFMENKSITWLSASMMQFSDTGELVRKAELSVHKQRYYDSLFDGIQDELVTDKESHTLVSVMKHPFKQGVLYRINEYYNANESKVTGWFQEVE